MELKDVMRLILAVVPIVDNCHLQAQDYGLEYTAEWQTNFKGDYNWVNLLRLSASLPVTDRLTIEGATISVAKTGDDPIICDMQGFSNIEADNLPLAFAVLGAEYRISRSAIFFGIRNVNEDYFTSPVTSFFINSSCGIFPTISCNFDIANYPLSSLGVHYQVDIDHMVLRASLYDGRGHSRILGDDNMFSFSPSKNGLFSILSADYINDDVNYNLGCAVYYGKRPGDEDGIEEETVKASTQAKKVSVAPWLNIEQPLSRSCALLVQGSFSSSGFCKCYFGLGSLFKAGSTQIGLFTDYARFDGFNEWASELTCRIPIAPALSLMPAIELIRSDRTTSLIGLMRLSYTI